MKKFNVPAIDGIPGIMPGTLQVPPPQEFDEEELTSTPNISEGSEYSKSQTAHDAV